MARDSDGGRGDRLTAEISAPAAIIVIFSGFSTRLWQSWGFRNLETKRLGAQTASKVVPGRAVSPARSVRVYPPGLHVCDLNLSASVRVPDSESAGWPRQAARVVGGPILCKESQLSHNAKTCLDNCHDNEASKRVQLSQWQAWSISVNMCFTAPSAH
jgi:hypothetical protein